MTLMYVSAVFADISGTAGAPPGPVGTMLQNFLNYTLWLGVILSAIGAIIGFGIIAAAHLGGSNPHANRGKIVALGGLAGAAGAGLAIPLVNLLFSTAGGK